MTTLLCDRQTIRTALSLASRAPSVHNSQPWRWRVAIGALHLYADRDRHLPNTDPDGRDLLLSCGACLHHAVVAFAALGYDATVHRFPDPAQPDHLASVELHPRPACELDVALAAAIPLRRTDRRVYSDWTVPSSDIAMMGARAARMGVMLRQVESLPDLQRIVARAARLHMSDDDYLRELSTWSGRHAALAGVPARSTPESPSRATVSSRFFAGPQLAQPDVSPVDDAGVVVALGTKDDSPPARLRAGEATSMVLLTATVAGLASCPVTEPLEIAETRGAVMSDVFGDTGYPQMLLRIGWAPVNADPLPATPRRPLADVIERVE